MTPKDVRPVVTVVVVTWNGKAYALECLDSLMSLNEGLALEIIVVDNASTDGTPEAIEERYPDVHLIRNSSNLGFARANNLGIQLSRGEYVALVNSDVVVPNGCFTKILDYLRTHPEVGLLGPKMLSPDGGIGASVYRVPTVWNYLCAAVGLHLLLPKSKWFGGYLMTGYPYNRTEDVGILTGWFWVVPRKALEQVGGLDEEFFMYGEDLDWSYRFSEAGWRVVFFAEAEALHYGAASSGRAPNRFYVEKVRANLQFFRKHYGVLGVLGFVLATMIHEVGRIIANAALYFLSSRRSAAAFKISRSWSSLRWMTTFALGSESVQVHKG